MPSDEVSKDIIKWPIHPPFLSIRKDVNKNSDDYHPNHDGLFHTDELRGFLADASDDVAIDNILALFQVVPHNFTGEDFDPRIFDYFSPQNDFIRNILKKQEKQEGEEEQDEQEKQKTHKIIRIFPGNLYNNSEPCKLFRDECEKGNEKCFAEDSSITLLYHPDLKAIHFDDQFDNFYSTLDSIVHDYNKHSGKSLELKKCKDNKHLYIRYLCPHSTLEEQFFPVTHSGKVIAVLMQGQRFPEIFDPEEMFVDCRNTCYLKAEKFNIAIDEFVKKRRDPKNKLPMSDERQKAIIKRIKRLENRYGDSVDALSQKYVSTQFFELEDSFRNKVNEKINIDFEDERKSLIKAIENLDNKLETYKTVLNKTLADIFDKFNHGDEKGFIRIYAIESFIADMVNPKKNAFFVIGNSKHNQAGDNSYSKLIFNKIRRNKNTIEKEELLKLLPDKYRPEGFNKEKDIFRMEILSTSQLAYVVWEQYSDLDESQYNKYILPYLKLMYHTFLEPYIILMGMKFEKNLETTMRISAHEVLQIIPSVIHTINIKETLDVIENGKKYIGDITKPAYKIIDASFRLTLLEQLFGRSSYIFKDKPPTYTYQDFHRIIYAAESLFQEKSYLDNMQNLNVTVYKELNKFYFNTDYGYLSHVLFNLVDNAIKHGLRGSNIFINVHWQNVENVSNKIIISVVSYGNKIEEKDRVFDLFYRSSKAKDQEGMGIGLFLAKKLCKLLGYEIKCKTSVKIEDYHVPVKYFYSEQESKYMKDSSIKSNIKSILQKRMELEHVLAVNFEAINKKVEGNKEKNVWEITVNELDSMLFQPTYLNEFEITIPVKANDLIPI